MRTHTVQRTKLDDCRSSLEELLSSDSDNTDIGNPISTKNAIVELYPALHGLQQRGYGTAQLAEKLSEMGIAITESTLRNYLTHARKTHRPKQKRISRPPKPKTQKPTVEATPAKKPIPTQTAISGQMNIVPDDDDI